MSELADTVREALAAFAAADPGLKRFGAAQHRYVLAPPIDVAPVEDALGRLPEDLRVFAREVGSGGAGPSYGWLPLARAAAAVIAPPAKLTAWTRALPIAHLGCGYLAVLPLDGSARGEIWIDARAVDVVAPIAGSFTAFYLDWIDRLARAAWPPDPVRPGACALASALSGYLGMVERQLGIERGSLAGVPLREALGALGPGAIRIAAESAPELFAPEDPVDPCITCARMLDALATEGLRRDVIAAGVPPRFAR